MFLKILLTKANFAIFTAYYRFVIFDVIVTSHGNCLMFILVDIGRNDHDLYIDTKYKIIGPLLQKIFGGCNNPTHLVRYDTKKTLVR